MKNKFNFVRRSAPTTVVDSTPATAVPVEKKPALWRRAIKTVKAVATSTVKTVKAAAASTAKVVVVPFRFVARKFAKPAGVVKSAIRRMYRAVVSTAHKMSPGLRMFARVWALCMTVGVWLGLLITVPEVCVALTFLTGLSLIGLAKLVEFADAHGGWVRRFVDMLDSALWFAGWGLIGIFTVAVVTASVVNAVTFVLMASFWIVYRWPVEDKTVFEAVEQSTRRWHPNFDTGFAAIIDANESPQQDDEHIGTPVPPAWQCVACGTPEGAMRVNGWCTSCFKALEEDFAAETSKRHNTEYTLDPTDYQEHLAAVRLSRKDSDHVYWAETSWWIDRKGLVHPRTWTGFLQGSAIAHVDYRHGKDKHQRVYRAFLRETQLGTYWRVDTAKIAIIEYMVDVGYAVSSAMQSLTKSEIVPQQGGTVLSWQTNG